MVPKKSNRTIPIDEKIVGERLGHSTVAITLDIYSEVIPDMQREAIEKIKDFV